MNTLQSIARGALLLVLAGLMNACGGGGGGGAASGSGNASGDPHQHPPPPNTSTAPPDLTAPPPVSAELQAPTLRLTATAVKTLRFDWADVAGETEYRLWEDAQGNASYEEIARLPANTAQHEHRVFLPARLNARYRLQACRDGVCLDSDEVAVTGTLAAVGYAKGSPAAAQQQFGHHVALSSRGDWLAIAALAEGDGAVHLFQRGPAGWRLQRRITAGDAGARAFFGAAVALSAEGEVLAVGAVRQEADGNGAVYLFRRQDEIWSASAVVKAPVAGKNTNFGHNLALSADGRRLAVGASDEGSIAPNSGAVHVFDERDGLWSAAALLKATQPAEFDGFGAALALSADGLTLAVGVPGEDRAPGGAGVLLNSGAVYLFTRADGSWPRQAYLKTSSQRFGASLSLSANGDRLAVGAPNDGGSDKDAGAVYLYSRQGTDWSASVRLSPWHPARSGQFGWRVALSGDGDWLAVSTPYDDTPLHGIAPALPSGGLVSGSAYVYRHSPQAWQGLAHLKAPNASAKAQFGSALAFAGDGQTLAVSAVNEGRTLESGIGAVPSGDGGAPYSGAVYLY